MTALILIASMTTARIIQAVGIVATVVGIPIVSYNMEKKGWYDKT